MNSHAHFRNGLVEITTQGRERYCEARLDQLDEVSAWVENYRGHWESKLDSLETYLKNLKSRKKIQGERNNTADREQFIQTVRTFKNDVGLRQNVAKLYKYLEGLMH